MKYEIPKEIRSKPKILGMEMKELVILLVGFFLIFTVLKDMVHSLFVIPYFIVSIGVLLWAMMPSRNNPTKKNYQSIVLYFKHDKYSYHALDRQKILNEEEFLTDEKGDGSIHGAQSVQS